MVGAFFGLAQFQVTLPGVGGLDRIHASSQAGLLEKVSPAFVCVGRTLTVLVLTHHSLSVLPSLDDFDYACGYISTNVVTDKYVGRFRVVDWQRDSPFEGRYGGMLCRVPVLSLHLPDGHTMRSRVAP